MPPKKQTTTKKSSTKSSKKSGKNNKVSRDAVTKSSSSAEKDQCACCGKSLEKAAESDTALQEESPNKLPSPAPAKSSASKAKKSNGPVWEIRKTPAAARKETQKLKSEPDNYVLYACILYTENPLIWRKLSCPANATFADLHLAFQVAFGWGQCHQYQFEFETEPPKGKARGETLQISQTESFMDDDSLKHRYAWDIKLHDILEEKKWLGDHDKGRFIYEYDMGDSWEHGIEIDSRAPATKTFECLEGGGHPCAEDAGSIPGWEDLIDAYKAKRPSQEQKERKEWYQTMCSNGDRLGLGKVRLEKWNKQGVNRDLKGIYVM